MRKIIFIMTIAASLLFVASANAQELDEAMLDQISEQLSASDASEMNQALQQIERAKAQLGQAASKQAQADKLRAEAKSASKGEAKKKNKEAAALEQPIYTQQVNAYNVYEKGYATLYGIFAANIKELASIGASDIQGDISDLTTFAADTWTKADKALKAAPTGKKVDQKALAKVKQDANANQLRAIRYQIEAYKLLLAFNEKPDTPSVEVVSNNDGSNANEADESDGLAETSQPSDNADTMDDEGFSFVQGNNTTDRIIYKVQIAADAIPLSIAKLRQICPTDDIINNEVQNGIYRYTVGYYTTYEEAKKTAITLRGKGVDGAFVVAYKNGDRIKEIRDVYNNK